MRKLFSSLLTIVLTVHLMAQGDCSDAAIMAMKGGWKKHPDANLRYDKNQARINRCLDSIYKICQEGCGELQGVDATWYRTGGDPMTPGGSSAYNFNSLYKAWYCNQHAHQLMLGDETGTWVDINVNSLGDFLSDQHDQSGLELNGKPVYFMPQKIETWKGYDLYQASGRTLARCVVITRSGLRPWRPLSQKEFLQAYRAFVQKQRSGSVVNTAAMQEDDKKEIEKIRNNPNLKPEMKEAGIRGVQNREAMYAASADKNAAMLKQFDDRIGIIDNYLVRTPENELQQPAWIDPRDRQIFSGRFSSESQGGRLAIVLDPATYFSKEIPAYAPQVIVLHWRWDNKLPCLHFKQQFEENFPIDKLAAMVDNKNK